MPTVRPEQPGDEAGIRALHAACFPTPAEARLVDLLRAAAHLSVSLVAAAGGDIVGQVAFSPVTVVATSAPAGVGLGPLAVLPQHRRQGAAAEPVRTGLAACRAAGFGWAVVLGDPGYGRFGFRAAAAAAFGLSDEYRGGPAFQALELVPGALPPEAGRVRYAPAFATLE